MLKQKKVPMRMCVVCREMKPKNELARIVMTESGIYYDKIGKLAGRGAYMCKSQECMDMATKKKALNRAFSCNISAEQYSSLKESILGKD